MRMAFHQKHFNGWSAVANDFNPIRFDGKAAGCLGFDHGAVHGMLPLLHIKHRLSQILPELSDEWTTIDSKLRQPVALDQAYWLEINARSTGQWFFLRRDLDGAEVITGSARRSYVPPASDPVVGHFRIDKAIAREKMAIFEQVFPKVEDAWILLDSIVFSQFLSNDMASKVLKSTAGFDSGSGRNGSGDGASTVQVSQTVSIAPELRALAIEDFELDQPIECNILPPVTTAGAASAISALQMNVSLGRRFVMQTEISASMRFGPGEGMPIRRANH